MEFHKERSAWNGQECNSAQNICGNLWLVNNQQDYQNLLLLFAFKIQNIIYVRIYGNGKTVRQKLPFAALFISTKKTWFGASMHKSGFLYTGYVGHDTLRHGHKKQRADGDDKPSSQRKWHSNRIGEYSNAMVPDSLIFR